MDGYMTNRPNFIIVFPDQWRGDCLGINGHPTVQTPFLDHLASDGVLFTCAYSAAPTCIPARACLATGQTPSTHGRLGYQDGVPWNYHTTLMNCLRNGGYQTLQAGKTHFYPQRAALGFEEMRLYEVPIHHPGFESDYHHWLQNQTGGRIQDVARQADPNTWVVKTWDHDEAYHCTNWIVDSGIELLSRRDPTRPFFLQLGIHRPHAPYDPPKTYYDLYADCDLEDVPVGDWAEKYDFPTRDVGCWQGRLPKKILDQTRRAYYASITHIDYQIGKLFNWLRVHHLLENTYILFLSDHGEQLGDHCQFRKATPFEGSAKIPFILYPPKGSHFNRGAICKKPVTHMDIMPTVLELSNVAIPDSVEGKSLVPLLQGVSDGWREYMHGEHANRTHGWQYLTDGKEKYIWETLSGKELFFDLVNDPQEKQNKANNSAYSKRVTLWRERLIANLALRPQDGLSDGHVLLPGKVLLNVRSGDV